MKNSGVAVVPGRYPVQILKKGMKYRSVCPGEKDSVDILFQAVYIGRSDRWFRGLFHSVIFNERLRSQIRFRIVCDPRTRKQSINIYSVACGVHSGGMGQTYKRDPEITAHADSIIRKQKGYHREQ
jgi:hypothetical protein